MMKKQNYFRILLAGTIALSALNANAQNSALLEPVYEEVHMSSVLPNGDPMDTEVSSESLAGLNANDNLTLTIFPNPSNGNFTISYRGNAIEFTILDQNGRTVLWKPLEIMQDINIQGFQSGLYSVKITGANGKIASKKLVVF